MGTPEKMQGPPLRKEEEDARPVSGWKQWESWDGWIWLLEKKAEREMRETWRSFHRGHQSYPMRRRSSCPDELDRPLLSFCFLLVSMQEPKEELCFSWRTGHHCHIKQEITAFPLPWTLGVSSAATVEHCLCIEDDCKFGVGRSGAPRTGRASHRECPAKTTGMAGMLCSLDTQYQNEMRGCRSNDRITWASSNERC
jgi:hypothetical protein